MMEMIDGVGGIEVDTEIDGLGHADMIDSVFTQEDVLQGDAQMLFLIVALADLIKNVFLEPVSQLIIKAVGQKKIVNLIRTVLKESVGKK